MSFPGKQSAMQLRQQQLLFTAALRDPENNPLPDGVTRQRLDVYHELFFNNFTGVIASAFPVIKKILPEAQWMHLVTEFYQQHACVTPEFPRMPQEFVRWLENSTDLQPAFLAELALWEWTELDIALDEAEVEFASVSLTLDSIIQINPASRLLAFTYPVHEISESHQPQTPAAENQFLCAWRQADYTIDFMQLNPASAAFLQLLMDESDQPFSVMIEHFAGLLGVANDESFTSFALGFVNDLAQRGVVVSASP